jgi:uncharacterized OB-fold protein
VDRRLRRWRNSQLYTVVHHAAHAAVADWIPYTILLVDLIEGPRVIGRLLDAPGEPEIGTPGPPDLRALFKSQGSGLRAHRRRAAA